jgi:hypothetical protein
MPIEFTHLHNLVRTYQRSLHLNEPAPPSTSHAHTDKDDRVSISREAREEQRHQMGMLDADLETDASASESA